MKVAVKSAKAVLGSAMALPAKSRARIAEKLIASLDGPNQKEIDSLWAAEAEDRIRAFERGEIKSIEGREVFRSLRARNK